MLLRRSVSPSNDPLLQKYIIELVDSAPCVVISPNMSIQPFLLIRTACSANSHHVLLLRSICPFNDLLLKSIYINEVVDTVW